MSENFPQYHKIETLFDRKEDFSVDTTKIRKRVFSLIKEWVVTEKIDGTNIRILLPKEGDKIRIGGRSNSAQIPMDLLQYLMLTFQLEKMKETLWIKEPCDVMLVGEGYGAGIQKGGGYRKDKAFILFDVLIAGKWWISNEDTLTIANKLDIQHVPLLGVHTVEEIVDQCKVGFGSLCNGASLDCLSEGIVARPLETIFDKNGDRIIFKLKTKDFVAGKR